MISPWDRPQYLERVWCVFEIFVANNEKGVKSEIIMPEKEKKRMLKLAAENLDKLLDSLAYTRIEDAKAYILALVEDSVGYYELNKKVNKLLCSWIWKTLKSEPDYSIEGYSNSTDDASKLDVIGEMFRSMSDYDTALEAYEKRLAIDVKTLGMDHPDIAITYSKIGALMLDLGDFDGALDMYEKCASIREKTFGMDHPGTAKTYRNIADVMRAKGDYDGALEMYERGLAVEEKTLGKDHPSTARSYSNIGVVMQDKGDYDGALEMYQKCLSIHEKTLGNDHPATINTRKAIAEIILEM